MKGNSSCSQDITVRESFHIVTLPTKHLAVNVAFLKLARQTDVAAINKKNTNAPEV